ncbi:MAG: SDR family NAD(P)-dependent oxidoreductase [Bdellovibrionaceae bacterium]|nr:SDR family NAD(P)-dependent oxidoreductase [Pseudobdellovibrionaceae bacterium]
MKTWGIIGVGWLGSELSSRLKLAGQKVWGTRRKDFEFDTDEFPTAAADVLFLNTPPLIQMSPDDYVNKITTSAKKILFVSSTSVYGNNKGKINESTVPEPKTESAKWLVEVERKLRFQFGEKLTVIRPGGLIGEDRHPIHSLSGKTNVPDGNKRVHLIHREDLVQLILAIADIDGCAIVNAVAPYHPAKSQYYKSWAVKLGLPEPTFTDDGQVDREIESIIVPRLYREWRHPKLD